MKRWRSVCGVACAALSGSPVASAGEPRAIGVSPAAELGASLGLALPALASEVWKRDLVPMTCRVCGTNAFDSGVRNALRWKDTSTPDLVSYGTAGAVMGASLTLLRVSSARAGGEDWRRSRDDGVLVFEATSITLALTQLAKFLVVRERPFVHALPESEKGQTRNPADNNLSFFSGHTSIAFAMATSAGTVSSMRGYSLSPYIWSVGVGLAATTGYLRIAADKHYATDVIVGAVVGSAVGVVAPLVFHTQGVSPSPGQSPGTGVSRSPTQMTFAGWF